MAQPSTYTLIDSGNFRKLEQVGPHRIVRPSPQAVWRPRLADAEWQKHDAEYVRFSGGQGEWRIKNKRLPKHWDISVSGVPFAIELTDFGHLGIFPEQAPHWLNLRSLVEEETKAGKEFNVLNLFAYTGGSSLTTAMGGAKVVHVDASKSSVEWARENASRLGKEFPIRWIIDDVRKFVTREVKRGSHYQGIILDPPSYGRGTKNEIWKIEEHLVELLGQLKEILADDYKFVMLSSHSQGYTPIAMRNLLADMFGEAGNAFDSGEMLVPEIEGNRELPSGAFCLLKRSK